MNTPETIIYEVENGRARITLNRPEKLNALSNQLQEELNTALWEADNDVARPRRDHSRQRARLQRRLRPHAARESPARGWRR